ncbi:MAG: FkbM family methyltransferase [Chthoniobacterales bacterium]|nr:FkbM family methyltransferase [Chthoniobacterales bacterium]
MNSFLLDYTRALTGAIGADFGDNWDTDRFGPEPADASVRHPGIRRLLASAGLMTIGAARQTVAGGIRFVEPHLDDLEWLYGVLADEESRSMLVQLAAFRALGHRKVKLPTNAPGFWHGRDEAKRIPCGIEEIDPGFLGWKLHQRNLANFNYPITMFTGPGACYTTFVHQQYRCETADGVIECESGDMVVDAGGCYGDTALYFAHKSGAEGMVASFEFLPVNLSVFRRNMELNPELAARIQLHECPVYSESGRELFVVENGPGTRVQSAPHDPGSLAVRTFKIDDLVARGGLPRIDFIKMDIEGAELEALKGSEFVLRQFRPKLAVTVYHDFKDFWTIPRYIDGLGLGYRFYLRHFTIHSEETVLFARVPEHTRSAAR